MNRGTGPAMTDDPEAALWRIEDRLWLGGVEGLRSHMDGNAVMVLPVPTGILRGAAILERFEGAPRWRTVRFSERSLKRTGDLALLAYRVSAERPDAPIFEAFCASSYLHDGEDWRLISHQQTPA
jgi:hypothetical protein